MTKNNINFSVVRLGLRSHFFLINQCCFKTLLFLLFSLSDCLILTHLKGVPDTMPHDWFIHNCYIAGPTTVWQLGVVLFEILHKKLFKTTSFLSNKLKISKRLSKSEPITCPHISQHK
ncbi:hypothetical protein AMECASPLE_006067 [Ameca splendens]|uniref:Protein kinase domain-containing protein n=1 Tax=Ameca splendens TaxID=208324 RepID=A0ABV0XNA2_9TELE